MYDPDLGRFLSADPTVQQPLNSQNLNRYSYVLNNPLSYTDPSGYFFGKIFDAIGDVFDFVFDNIRTIAAIAVAAVIMYYCPGCAPLAGFASGMIGSGGDLRAGIIGAFTANAFQGIGAYFDSVSFAGEALVRTVAHGVVGGLSSLAQGGDFLSGFVSAGATQAFALSGGFEALGGADPGSADFGGFDYVHNMVVAAVVGGTAAVLGGGKFKNGALTGAFSYLFAEGANAVRKQARAVAVPEEVNTAVEKTFESVYGGSVNVDQIRVIENSKWADFISGIREFFTGGRSWVIATTQPDTIYLNSRITAQQFFGDPELLLHEYYHVIRQWNTGAMSNFNYIMSPSTWEQPAIDFGQNYKGTYQTFQGGP